MESCTKEFEAVFDLPLFIFSTRFCVINLTSSVAVGWDDHVIYHPNQDTVESVRGCY